MTGIVVLGGVTSGMAATKSSAVSSGICSKWGDGYFFNYAMTSKGDLSTYQSSYTCSAVAKAGAPVTYDGGCACRCTNPTQVFDPAAAEQCAQKGDATACGSVCADIRRTVQCSAAQRPYYIDDTWQCCIFYDPMSKTCITDTNTWKNFLAQTMKMSGGYVAADGLPTECPNGTTADETTGMCLCPRGGWFSMYAGTCVTSLAFKLYTSSQLSEYSIETVDFGNASEYTSRNKNFTDTFGRNLFDESGHFIYTPTSGTQAIAAWYDIDDGTGGVPVITAVPGDVFVLTLRHNGGVAYTGGPSYTRAKEIYATRWTNYAGSTTITTIPGITRSGYTFRGFYTSQLEDAEASTTSTSGFKMKTTLPSNISISSDTTWYAAWAKNCAPGSHATCSLTIGSSGQVTYTTGCDSGYTISSGSGTYNPVCSNSSSVTITLNKNGGTGTCGGASGTNNGSITCTVGGNCTLPSWNASTCNLTKSGNKIFVGWATSSDAIYPDYTTSGTFSGSQTLYAVWQNTYCDYMPSVVQNILSGSPTALTPVNNAPQCQYTCAHGYAYNNDTQRVKIGTAGNPGSATLADSSESCNQSICYKFAIDNTYNGGNNNNGATTEFWMYIDNNHDNSANCDIYPTINDCRNDTNAMSSIVFPNAPTNGFYVGLYSATGVHGSSPQNEGWFNSDGSENITEGYDQCDSLSNTQGFYSSLLNTFGFQASSTPSITLRALYECANGYRLDKGVCVADTVTVSYDANGGSGSMQLSTTCNSGESCTLQTWNNDFPHPCNITNGNKIFLGWSTDPNATTATYTTSGTFTSDTLLYAVWTTPACWVTNGSGTITTPSNNAPQCVVTCDTGYQTSGTYTGTAGGTFVSYTCGVGQYLLTLTDNKQTSNTRSLFEIYGNRWASNSNGQPSSTTSITTVPDITRTGYKFRGYYTSDLDDVTSNAPSTTGFKMKTVLTDMVDCAGTNCTETLTSDTEWFAAWAKDCAPGSHATCSLTIGSSGQVTYTTGCDSGYTISSGSGTYNPVCSNSSSVTITLNKNGGSGTCGGATGTNNGSITCTVGGNCTLPSWNASTCNLTKSGNKIFVGWTTTAPANHTSSTTGTTGSISSPASNTTYYAVWKDTSCSVTNGTASATTPSNNAPRCVVTCDTGYQTSGTYTGTAGNPDVDTGQCSVRTVRVLANDSNGNTYNNWVSCVYGGTCTLQSGDVFSAPSGSSGFGKWLCRIGSHNASGTTCGDFTSGQTLTVAQSNALVLADTEVERTLYACWNYGITYNLNSGTAATTASSRPTSYNHCDGATIGGTAAASKPTRTGYTFAGWCDDAELTSNCNVTRTISAGTTGAKTYYAKWTTDAYTVTLDANGGTIPSGGTTSVSATYGDAMPAIQTGNKLPTREYYTFAGYYDTSAATGGTMYYTAAGASARPWDKTSDTRLYARWTKVSYSLQLSKAPITECQFADKYYYYTPADGKWYSNSALTDEITTGGVNYDPSCSGYVFRGWYWYSPSGYNDPIGPGAIMTHNTTIAAGQNAPNSYQPYALNANNLTGKSLSSNTYLYARWAQNCATVANGSCSLNVEANGNVTYTDSCNSNYSLVENGVYNPVCSPVYTVSFNANGGSGSASPTSVTCVYDQDCTLAAKGTLAKSNATFDGWNTETDGSGNGYLESDTVQNLTGTAGATVVLYAVWRTSGCSAGQYLDDGACVPCPAGYSCAGGDALPVMCGTNKYSTGGAVNCSSCTGGLTTSPIADARYHDEAADCGRKLHIGAYEIRLKSIPSTGALSSLVPSPALRFNYSGNASGRPDFYANMSTIASPMRVTTANNDGTGAISTTGSGDKFKTRYNNTNYYVCDDVTCVTE